MTFTEGNLFFTEESLMEARLEDLELLARLRKGKINFNTKKYLTMYYAFTLATLCDNVNSAIAKLKKFCSEYLDVSSSKDNQAVYYKREMIARIEAKQPKMLSTRYIIQNLKISKEEMSKMKLLIDEETVELRAKKRLNKILNNNNNNSEPTTVPSIDDPFDDIIGQTKPESETDDLPF